jgi:peptidoglycan/xylan/chitin deacetylase (PgdA/CDA1 family)
MDKAVDVNAPRDESWHDRVLGSRVVAGAVSAITRGQLRILAYHDVQRPERFATQIAWLATCYTPVALEDVAAAVAGKRRLPDQATWVTFDDGHPEVVELAQPVLDQYGIAATLFVCPAFVDTDEPYWWDVVADACALEADVGTSDPDAVARTVARLKRLPDDARRKSVDQARARLAALHGKPPSRPQLRSDQLEGWLAAGHSVGNHSWDHPCLDRCSPEEQARQVLQADSSLSRFGTNTPKVFAYPNGSWVAHAEDVLRDRGYEVGVVFDHRLARVDGPRLRMSRLRVSTDDSLARFRAIVSGAHPAAFALARRER